MGDQPKTLHIAMFPWAAFGHILPFLELAKLIAQRGHKISFLSTPKNIQRFPKIPPNISSNIDFVSLILPKVENLPQHAEATMDLPSQNVQYLKMAYDGLQPSLAKFLENSMPDWVMCDFAPYWLPPLAAKLGIPCAHFSIFQAWTITFLSPSWKAMVNGEDYRCEPKHFTVPPKWIPFPSKVALKIHEAKRAALHFEKNVSGTTDIFRAASTYAGCDVILCRSCMELEGDYLKLLEELHGKPVVPVGILPPSNAHPSDEDDPTWITISQWLDKQARKGPVVYVGLGSEITLSQEDVTELATGLELSGLPFFWALRKNQVPIELPEGFEERVKGRGLVWMSWVPQVRIFGHESIGGFLTHCGISSVVEALYFGLPLIMLPYGNDQPLSARIFEEKKVGVEVPRDDEDGLFTAESMAETLRLVVVDEEGEVYRENAKKMRSLFRDKELQKRYIDHSLEFLQNHRESQG